ncbi:CoxG family protein [Virgibacillus sp. W0430]|uniref:CoxG family protein n=1 Tax=Virgibacillus sp. W0430 TaxID=3391580 RepID=UPI003F44728A
MEKFVTLHIPHLYLKIKEVFTIPSGIHETNVDVSLQRVWTFVSNIDLWAPLAPGYRAHEVISNRQSTWCFTGDVGFIQKEMHLNVHIKEWNEPSKITFELCGLNENIIGDGYFKAKKLHASKTKITGFVNMRAYGLKGPMINPVLKAIVPKMTQQLTIAVANKIRHEQSLTLTT